MSEKDHTRCISQTGWTEFKIKGISDTNHMLAVTL